MHAKNIHTETFLREKSEYIHNHPLAKHWQLAEQRDEYGYSSACFYDRGIEPFIAVDDAPVVV